MRVLGGILVTLLHFAILGLSGCTPDSSFGHFILPGIRDCLVVWLEGEVKNISWVTSLAAFDLVLVDVNGSGLKSNLSTQRYINTTHSSFLPLTFGNVHSNMSKPVECQLRAVRPCSADNQDSCNTADSRSAKVYFSSPTITILPYHAVPYVKGVPAKAGSAIPKVPDFTKSTYRTTATFTSHGTVGTTTSVVTTTLNSAGPPSQSGAAGNRIPPASHDNRTNHTNHTSSATMALGFGLGFGVPLVALIVGYTAVLVARATRRRQGRHSLGARANRWNWLNDVSQRQGDSREGVLDKTTPSSGRTVVLCELPDEPRIPEMEDLRYTSHELPP